MSDFTKCCVRITNPNTHTILGTGIIITTDGYIVTCYHNIKKLISEKKQDLVEIHFPSDSSKRYKARILEEYCNSFLDVAVLKIEGKLFAMTNVANLGVYASEDSPFRSFGFRKDELFDGLFASGKIYGMVQKKRSGEVIDVIQLSSADIGKGMSGSPVLDVKKNKIVGIISESWEKTEHGDRDLAFAIPILSLAQVFHEIKHKNSSLSNDLDKIDKEVERRPKTKTRSEVHIRSQNEIFVGRKEEIKKIQELMGF
jgi:S1-C subfamily serine protease